MVIPDNLKKSRGSLVQQNILEESGMVTSDSSMSDGDVSRAAEFLE